MGLQLCTPVGSGINMQRILIASCLTVSTLADPGLVGGNVLVGPGGLSPAWPAVAGLGVESTCFGCRPFHILGKRSADPAIHPEGLVLTHNNNLYSGFTGNHYATGLPGRSFAAVTHLGKREAEPTADADAEADPYYGYYGYGRRYGYGLGYR